MMQSESALRLKLAALRLQEAATQDYALQHNHSAARRDSKEAGRQADLLEWVLGERDALPGLAKYEQAVIDQLDQPAPPASEPSKATLQG